MDRIYRLGHTSSSGMEPGQLSPAGKRLARWFMSRFHAKRLLTVTKAYQAAIDAITCVILHYDDQLIQQRVGNTSKHTFAVALKSLEDTYTVRLFAEFEGVLRDHLRSNHPSVKMRRDVRVSYLLQRILQRDNIVLDPVLRAQFELLRETRNTIAHQSPQRIAGVSFIDAQKCLARIVDKLPEPHQP